VRWRKLNYRAGLLPMILHRHRLLLSALVVLGICVLPSTVAYPQNSTSTSDSQENSWTSSTTSQNSMGVNPIRTGETHTQAGNRTTDSQSLQRLGPDGYEPYLDVEKETVRVDATTVRIIQRSYAYSDGQRRLAQTTEEESHTLPGGEVKTVRTTSNSDANGALQVVQRDIEDTKQTGPGAQETTTAVFTAGVNGELSESSRTDLRQTQTGAHTIQFQETTRLKDGNGDWQTAQVRQGLTTDDGKEQSREETVSQPNADGNSAVVRRDVSRQSSLPGGATQTTSETDSVDLPGTPREGGLYPLRQVTTTSKVEADGGQTTRTTVRQPDPGSPTSAMQITVQTTDTTHAGPDGVTQTRVIQSFSGQSASAVWVDFGRSDKPAQSVTSPLQAPAPPSPASLAISPQSQAKP